MENLESVRSGPERALSAVIVVLMGVSALLGWLVWNLTTGMTSHIEVLAGDVNSLRLKMNSHIEHHASVNPECKADDP